MRVSNFRLGIGVPLSFPMIPSDFFDSFITMEKPDFVYVRTSQGHIDDMRNDLVRSAFSARCTHLIMMDADQVYHPQTITRLLSHRLPIVGCLVYRRYPPFDPLLLRGTLNLYQTIHEWTPGELVEVDATGTGCLLFDMDVFRNLRYPWFRFHYDPWMGPIGEDFSFCHEVRNHGYPIYVDTSVPSDHLSSMRISEGTYKLYNRMKQAELQAKHEQEHGVLLTKP